MTVRLKGFAGELERGVRTEEFRMTPKCLTLAPRRTELLGAGWARVWGAGLGGRVRGSALAGTVCVSAPRVGGAAGRAAD